MRGKSSGGESEVYDGAGGGEAEIERGVNVNRLVGIGLPTPVNASGQGGEEEVFVVSSSSSQERVKGSCYYCDSAAYDRAGTGTGSRVPPLFLPPPQAVLLPKLLALLPTDPLPSILYPTP
jgi:hypothetical protein